MPVLRALGDLPDPAAQIMLGYTAVCLQPTPDAALARTQYQRAAANTGKDDTSSQAAKEATRELQALSAAAANPTVICR